MKSLQTIFYYVVFVFYLFKKSFWHIYSFIYGCAGSLLLHEASTVVVACRSYSLLQCTGFSLWQLILLWNMGSRCKGFSSCGAWT